MLVGPKFAFFHRQIVPVDEAALTILLVVIVTSMVREIRSDGQSLVLFIHDIYHIYNLYIYNTILYMYRV